VKSKPLTGAEVRATLGPVDDVVIAEIIATGATADELAEARAWAADEALINSGRRLPAGRVGQLLRILDKIEENEEALLARGS
jgi:hypothetical protein